MAVTYKVVQIPGLAPGEVGYKLSDGSYVAVSFAPGEHAAPHMFSIKATARAVANDGTPIETHDGRQLCCSKHVSTPKSSLVTGQSSGPKVKDLALESVINDPDGLVAECAAAQAFVELFPPTHTTPKGVT